jgi:hypothetical protein
VRDVSINDIADLVVSDVPDPDKRIEKMFDWHFARDIEITRWVLGVAATVGAALLVAVFKAEISPNWWQALLLLAIALVTATYGLFRLFRARSIHRQFVVALRIHSSLRQVRPFLIRYRQARRG